MLDRAVAAWQAVDHSGIGNDYVFALLWPIIGSAVAVVGCAGNHFGLIAFGQAFHFKARLVSRHGLAGPAMRLDAAGKQGADGEAETGKEQNLSWLSVHGRCLVNL